MHGVFAGIEKKKKRDEIKFEGLVGEDVSPHPTARPPTRQTV